MNESRKLIEHLTRELVTGLIDKKTAVELKVIETRIGLMIGVGVDSTDVGKVLGASGATWRAMKMILAQVARRQKVENFTLELLPRPRKEGIVTPFEKVSDWDGEPFEALLREVMEAAFGSALVVRVDAFTDMSRFDVLLSEVTFDLGDFQRAAETLFHAIGKAQGKIVHIAMAKATEAELRREK